MSYRKNLLFVAAISALLAVSFSLVSPVLTPSVRADEVQIDQAKSQMIQAVKNYHLQPGATSTLRVTRIVSAGEYALANWLDGDGGGQAALIKKNGKWTVVGLGGGAMDQRNLVEYGFPADVAQQIIEQINKPPAKTQ
jgi:hypothetical protein